MMKVWFDPALSCDGGVGGLRIHVPVTEGFVEYTFVHSVVPEKNCDMWRMSVVNALNEKGEFLHPLTKKSAEWEMALRLADRPDFIGGFNHGDEIGQPALFILDGASVSAEELSVPRDASRLEISVDSVGYDPANASDAVLSHRKNYVFDGAGVHLTQEVTWLKDVVLDSKFKSYLAMMPPLKFDPKDEGCRITESFSFGEDDLQPITTLPVEKKETRKMTVCGRENGYRFTMSVDGYFPRYQNGCLALLTDNGKHMNYHKMYIAFAGGTADEICAGTVWRAKTHYRIEKI